MRVEIPTLGYDLTPSRESEDSRQEGRGFRHHNSLREDERGAIDLERAREARRRLGIRARDRDESSERQRRALTPPVPARERRGATRSERGR